MMEVLLYIWEYILFRDTYIIIKEIETMNLKDHNRDYMGRTGDRNRDQIKGERKNNWITV